MTGNKYRTKDMKEGQYLKIKCFDTESCVESPIYYCDIFENGKKVKGASKICKITDFITIKEQIND